MVDPVFLLGAGISVEAGLPRSGELTKRVLAVLRTSAPDHKEAVDLFERVATLERAQDPGGTDLSQDGVLADFERVLEMLSLMSDDHISGLAPLVAEWRAGLPVPVGHPFGTNIFTSTRGLAARACVPPLLTSPNAARLQYLKPLIKFARKRSGIVVGTVNYDNVVEMIASGLGLASNTCVADQWNEKRSITVPDVGLVLLKLHGSITWRYKYTELSHLSTQDICEQQDGYFGGEPANGAPGSGRVRCRHDHHKHALIYDPVAKISREGGPFIQLLAGFQAALWRASRLVVIGYSFRDPHINAIIDDWAPRRATSLTIVDPDESLDGNPWVFNLREELDQRFRHIRKKAGVWLEEDLSAICDS